MERCWPRLADRIPKDIDERQVMVYVSNSAKLGRIFGDPFTGQVAAYSTVFGELGKRVVLAWFPYQAHAQAITERRPPKGLLLMREVVDWMLFSGGVLVQPASGLVI